MKVLITIAIIVLVGFGSFKLWEHWQQVKDQRLFDEQVATGADIKPEKLPGLPAELETRLREAQASGPVGFKRFLDYCRIVPGVKDPRLAWMELDYVMLISSTDPMEAKKLYWEVKKRTTTNSPVYPRLRVLGKAYD